MTVTPGATLVVTVTQNTISTTVGGFAAGSVSMASIHSDPVALATATAGADGRASYTITIPSDLPPGEHHIVVSGVAPDGSERLWVVPVTLGADGQLAAIAGNVQTSPVRNLPATGTSPIAPLRAATLLLALGLITLAAGRRRAPVRSQ